MARFSGAELYELRNKISIARLLDFLKVATKLDGNILIFSCPCCSEFRTGINPQANLGRCFRCNRNFNPIELVMESRKCSFVASVKLLKQHFDKLSDTPVLTNKPEFEPKISTPNTSSENCLSCLELELLALATPKQSQSFWGRNA